MKNAIRFALAGVALAGSALAHGQAALPSTGNSDLWLFVTDPSTSQTYARDTGISIDSLAPSTYTTGATGVSLPANINLTADATLQNFLAANSGNTLYWGVQGDNQQGTKPNKAGSNLIVQANQLDPSLTEGINYTSFTSVNNGLNADEAYMAANVNTGTSFVFNLKNGSTFSNAWGVNTGDVAGSIDLYGQGANGENTMGNSAELYLITGNSSPTAIQSYVLSTDLQLASNGTLETVSSSPVPLPASFWLFGSGLLGLAGIGRRRSSGA